MGLVFNRNPGRKINLRWWCRAFVADISKERFHFEAFAGQSKAQDRFHGCDLFSICHRTQLLVADPEDVEHEIVSADKDIGAQNIDGSHSKRPGDTGQQLVTIPRTDRDNAVSLFLLRFPLQGWSVGRLVTHIEAMPKFSKEI